MKIVLFTENYYCGGLDTFISTLINHWPNEGDHFKLICNADHPGLANIRKNVRRPCEIVDHAVSTYSRFARRFDGNGILSILRKIVSPVLKYIFVVYNILALRKLLLMDGADRLMVVNGGYPAGDTCRAAVICWGLFSKKPPAVLNFHNLAVPPKWFLALPERIVDMLVARFSQRIIAVSKACAASLAVRPWITRRKVVEFIYNGIEALAPPADGKKSALRRELGVDDNAKLCLMLGTYEPRKGHGFLMEAFADVVREVPEAHLLICGYGTKPELDNVRRLVRTAGLEKNVRLFGFRSDKETLLAEADVLLVTSQGFESFGLTCVEAMSCKKPVVTTDIGGLTEVVAEGEGGYCVSHRDAKTYARAVINVLKDPFLRETMGKQGYQRFIRLFTATRMARDYAVLLN